jgi:hypothetical protein
VSLVLHERSWHGDRAIQRLGCPEARVPAFRGRTLETIDEEPKVAMSIPLVESNLGELNAAASRPSALMTALVLERGTQVALEEDGKEGP